jgi:hypothetical protein
VMAGLQQHAAYVTAEKAGSAGEKDAHRACMVACLRTGRKQGLPEFKRHCFVLTF